MPDFCDFALNAARILEAKAKVLDSCPKPTKFEWQIPLSGLDEAHLRALFQEMREALPVADRSVYVFQLTDPAAIAPLQHAIAAAKGGPRKLAKSNDHDPVDLCLYVGSSFATNKRTSTTASRIAQHLDLGAAATYAMHLAHWAGDLPGDVKITIYSYADAPRAIDRTTILLIEDQLAEDLKPLLGKRGSAR